MGQVVTRTTKLRRVLATSPSLTLTVPAHIAIQLQDLIGTRFVCHLTDEGILFVPAALDKTTLPGWAQGANGSRR